MGGTLVTTQLKVCVVELPEGSVAVIVTEYGPPADAFAASVPEIVPVAGLRLRPGGRFVAVKPSTSLASGSLK